MPRQPHPRTHSVTAAEFQEKLSVPVGGRLFQKNTSHFPEPLLSLCLDQAPWRTKSGGTTHFLGFLCIIRDADLLFSTQVQSKMQFQ